MGGIHGLDLRAPERVPRVLRQGSAWKEPVVLRQQEEPSARPVVVKVCHKTSDEGTTTLRHSAFRDFAQEDVKRVLTGVDLSTCPLSNDLAELGVGRKPVPSGDVRQKPQALDDHLLPFLGSMAVVPLGHAVSLSRPTCRDREGA